MLRLFGLLLGLIFAHAYDPHQDGTALRPSDTFRFSEQEMSTTPQELQIGAQICKYGQEMAGSGPGLERFKCLAETITTYANGKIPSQTGANHPSTCSTIAPTEAFGKTKTTKPISMAWCQGTPPISGQHYGYSQFWNSPAGGGSNTNWNAMQTFFEVDRHGVTMKLQPYGFDAAHHLPTPTACRSGDVANAVLPISISKKYHIANTYVATFVDSHGVWNTAKKVLRHGVLGYKKNDGFTNTQKQNHQHGVRDQAIALVDAFHFSRVVSLNVMNPGDAFTKGQREILRAVENVVNSATVHPTASRGPGTLNVAMATYGVNLMGRFAFQKTTYSDNIEAFQTMVDMVMEEVTKQMDPNDLRLPKNSATFNMPDVCEKTYRTKWGTLAVAVNTATASLKFNTASAATHTIGKEFDRIKQALHDALQHGGALQKQGRRNALKCVLTQVQEIFVFFSNRHLNRALNGQKAPGAGPARKRDNVVRAIEVLNALIYGGESRALHRSGDVVRMAAFSSFLGVDVWVNCKSGLDRTGGVTPLVSAFTMMVLSMESAGAGTLASTCPDTLMYIAVNWESILKSSTANALVDSYATDPTSNPPSRVCATGLNVDHKSDAVMLAVMQGHGAQLIAQLRSLTLEILLKTSVPITYLSTGVIGLKWAGGGKTLALGSAPTMGYLLPSRFMGGGVGPFDLTWLTDNSDRRGS